MPDAILPEMSNFKHFIRKLAAGHEVISFVGFERGSGKTTAFQVFLEALPDRTVGLTSIGTDLPVSARDNEKGGLHYVPAGSIIATARQALNRSDTTRKILASTDIQTSLGEVILFRAESAGHVFLAGPSMMADAIKIGQAMQQAGAQTILIDGAVDRKSSALPTLADGVVLSCKMNAAGKFYPEDKIAHQIRLMQTGILADETLCALCELYSQQKAAFFTLNEVLEPDMAGTEESIQHLLAHIEVSQRRLRVIYINGPLMNSTLSGLLKAGQKVREKLAGVNLVVEDPTRLFLDASHLQELVRLDIQLKVIHPIAVLALAVNPQGSGLVAEQIHDILSMYGACFNLPVIDAVGGIYFERI